MIILGLIISLVINILLIWYISRILSKLLYTADNLGDLYIAFGMFEKFVSSMYEMEMFYGEPILQELIDKTKLLREEIERFEDIYTLTTDIDEIEEELTDDTPGEETQEAY